MNHQTHQQMAAPLASDASGSDGQRAQKELLRATRDFVVEDRWRSWWYASTTMLAIAGLLGIAAVALWWPIQLLASILAALILVRGFILYHDYMHRAILRDAPVAAVFMQIFGMLMLAPPRSWKASHNHHHANVGKLAESSIGSFETMTIERWRASGLFTRLRYRMERSALVILLAYPLVFLINITLLPALRHPLRHWDSLLALLLHGGLIAATWWLGGWSTTLFVVFLPFGLATAIGAYLFYVQHNAPGIRLFPQTDWVFHQAALESCSFLRLNRIMRWFTGDIGFHHVHHLNARIPFYRLAETMQALPECRRPLATTTLWPSDILRCLRLKIWDGELDRLVGFRESRKNRQTVAAVD